MLGRSTKDQDTELDGRTASVMLSLMNGWNNAQLEGETKFERRSALKTLSLKTLSLRNDQPN